MPAGNRGLTGAERIRYDPAVTRTRIKRKPGVEFTDAGAATDSRLASEEVRGAERAGEAIEEQWFNGPIGRDGDLPDDHKHVSRQAVGQARK